MTTKNPTLKAQLREMKKANYSKLRNAVITDLLSYSSDSEDILSYAKDTLNHGCQSGNVGQLIYYTDTVKFFKRHKSDILAELDNLLSDCGFEMPSQLFGDKWNKSDYSLTDTQNQNLLAWFGYEEMVRNILNELDIEY